MKRVKIMIIVFGVFFIASCNKTYRCECKDANGTVVSDVTLTLKNKDAKAFCTDEDNPSNLTCTKTKK